MLQPRSTLSTRMQRVGHLAEATRMSYHGQWYTTHAHRSGLLVCGKYGGQGFRWWHMWFFREVWWILLVYRDCRVTEDFFSKIPGSDSQILWDPERNRRDLPKVTPGMFQGIYDETSWRLLLWEAPDVVCHQSVAWHETSPHCQWFPQHRTSRSVTYWNQNGHSRHH